MWTVMNGVPQANFANPAFPVMPPGVQPYPPAMMAANPAANVHQPQVSAQPVTLPPGPPHFGKAPSMQADQQTRPPSLFSTDSMDGRNEPLSPAGPNDAGGPPDLRGPPLTGPQQPVLPIPQDSQMAFGPAGAQPTDQKPHVPFAVAFMNIVRRTPRLLSMMVSFVGFILEIALVAQDGTAFINRGTQPTTFTQQPVPSSSTSRAPRAASQATSAASRTRRPATISTSLQNIEETLLGRRSKATATRMHRRHLHERDVDVPTVLHAPHYVKDTDIPWRFGAVGFVVFVHLSHATIFLALLWLDYRGYRGKEPMFRQWDRFFVAAVQIFLAFDILGRGLSTAVIAGAYFILLIAVINLLIAFILWLLSGRRSRQQAQQQPMPPMMEQPMAPLPTMPDSDGAYDMNTDPMNDMLDPQGSRSGGHAPRNSYDSASSGESDYSHVRRTRTRRRRPQTHYVRRLSPQKPTSPISLYNPAMQRSKSSSDRRARSRSMGHVGAMYGQERYSGFQERSQAEAAFHAQGPPVLQRPRAISRAAYNAMKTKDSFATRANRKRSKRPADSFALSLNSLSDEVILQCFSYLSATDLLGAQASRRLYDLTNDGQLWRRLFLQRFSSRPLRHRAEQWCSLREPTSAGSQRTWKDLYRISHNWATGYAASTQFSLRSALLPTLPEEFVRDVAEQIEPAGQPSPNALGHTMQGRNRNSRRGTHVAWFGQHYFVAQRIGDCQSSSCIAVFGINSASDSSQDPIMRFSSSHLAEGQTNANARTAISSIQIDNAPYDDAEGIRLAVFYSSGQYSIFRLRNLHIGAGQPIQVSEEYFSAHRTTKPVVASQLHSPLLVTSTIDGIVKFRLLEADTGSSRRVTLLRPTLQAPLAFAPMSLRLHRIERQDDLGLGKAAGPLRFRAALCYSTPFYPGSCTIGVQCFDITLAAGALKVGSATKRSVQIASRHAIAVPPDSTRPRMSPGAGNLAADLALVTSIEHDGRYIVAAKSDNTVSVYELSEQPSPAADSCSPLPKLSLKHARSLFGHTAAVDTVSVSNGRCVSTGIDGVKLWSLNGKSSASPVQLSQPETVDVMERSLASYGAATPSRPGKCDWIGLDSTRVIAVCSSPDAAQDRIQVYDFE